ncbi:sensor histidine kinase [Hymenobacter sp. BT491]|uniref:sensor histidine kinase n=1 Tax=Hymenobacter sp. BT491 TaxID=2766779 RepID=UPI001653A4CC|nr:histidine kinase [Hymenobacter sp. BT491]MBC6990384.1 histidine kinase [Hymenobacter sp. BT491]
MASFSIRRYISPLIQVLAWGVLGLMLLLFQPLSWRVTLPDQFWVKQGVLFCLWVGLFYVNAFVWVPRLLFRGHTAWFIVAISVSIVIVLGLNNLVESWLHLPDLMYRAFHPEGGRPRGMRRGGPWFDMGALLITLLVLGISTSVTAVQKWQKDAQIRQDLEQQKVTSELSFLKAQINPHFFFNTLNNIYALTVVNVELARQALHTLSRMMRYVLYETQTGTTLLSQELLFLQDYIALMQLRLTDKVTVSFERPEPMHDVPIAPMLLLPFVENAFKHGVSATLPSRIYVAVRQFGPTLELEVRNTVFSDKRLSLDESNGIGLTNTRRRLDLLYSGQYQLAVTEQTPEQEYLVHLTLQTL